MEFLYKMAYYVMFGISSLLSLFLCMTAISILMDAYKKNSEAIIMMIGALVIGTGVYMAYHIIQTSEKYLHCCGVLGIAWILALVIIMVGLFCFNGPIHWQ